MTSATLTYQRGYFIFNVQELSLGVQELTMETTCERNLYSLLLMLISEIHDLKMEKAITLVMYCS